MSKYLKTPRRRVTTLAAVLVVLGLAAAALAASTASGSRSDNGHAPGRAVRRLRLPRPVRQVREVAPEHRHQGRHRELRRPSLEPGQAPGGRLGRRRHRVRRGRLHRAVQVTAEPVREHEQAGREESPEAVAGLEVEAVGRVERRSDRPRHGRRQPRDLLPARPVQEGRPAEQPRGRLGAVADLGQVHRGRQAVPEARPEGRLLLRRRQQRLQRDHRPAEPRVLRRARQGDRRQQPEGEGGLEARR